MFDEPGPVAVNLRTISRTKLPFLEKGQVANFNRLARTAPSGTVTLNDKQLTYAWVDEVPDTASLTEEITISATSGPFRARVSRGFIEALFAGQVDFTDAAPGPHGVLFEHALHHFLDHLENRSGDPVRSDLRSATGDAGLTPYCFVMSVSGSGQPFYVTAYGDPELLNGLIGLDAIPLPPAKNTAVKVRATLVTDGIRLPRKELDQIKVGDILLYDSATPFDASFQLIIGGIGLGAVHISGNGIRLSEAASRQGIHRKIPDRRSDRMAKDELEKISDGLTVSITLEVGDWSIPVKDIDEMTTGTILDFDTVSLQQVKLLVNGQPFAVGSMIEVGEGVGLKIRKVL